MPSADRPELALGFESDPRVNEHLEMATVVELDAVLDWMSSWLDARGT
jgi:hypothetical protein